MRAIVAAVVACASFIALAQGPPAFPAKRPDVGEGQKAKELVVDRWLQTDAPLTLGGLRGRVVLLDFWGNWCASCVTAIPQVVKLARAKPDLTVIGIHSKMAAEHLEKFLTKNKYAIPIAVDGGATEKAYAVRGWPTYVLIDRRGNIRYRGWRLPPPRLVDELLAEP